jgi:hypothetical protein
MMHTQSLSPQKTTGLPGNPAASARSTRLAGSVRERAIARNAAKSSSPMANSIACRQPAITFIPSCRIKRKGYNQGQEK